jgi:hypothetical protein
MSYRIIQATREERYDIIHEPQLEARLSPKSIANIEAATVPYYFIEHSGYRMLFCYWKVRATVTEAHIICPANSIVASRVLGLLVITYLFAKFPGLDTLITTAPEGKIANYARRLGGIEYSRKNDLVYFKIHRQITDIAGDRI